MFKLLIITHYVGTMGVVVDTKIVEFATISARKTAQRNILASHLGSSISVDAVAL